MRKEIKIQKLVEKTKEVYRDCLLPNDCLVAAPTHMPYYPKQAKSYLYSWPGRDSGYCLTGGLLLGIDYFPSTLNWLWERAENFHNPPSHLKSLEGLILRNYHSNGRLEGTHFQCDQNGTLLWALSKYSKDNVLSPTLKKVARKAANGLVRYWNKTHFSIITEDLWEERIAHPEFETNFTYSLAATSCGLQWAGKYFSNKAFIKAAREMKNQILKNAYSSEKEYFARRFGGNIKRENGVDASMLALVWPYNIVKPSDIRMKKTVKKIEEKLATSQGIMRYEHDEYEGEIEMGTLHLKQGAGAWPLLTFWLAIVKNRMGDRKSAEKHFLHVIEQIDDSLLIPEQLFPKGDSRVGIQPLLWSHMMFIHAANELGYL